MPKTATKKAKATKIKKYKLKNFLFHFLVNTY